MTDLDKKLQDNDVSLIVCGEDYQEAIVRIVKEAERQCGKICYVTLNKPYASLTDLLRKKGIAAERFFFIDGISKRVNDGNSPANCVFVTAPDALTELNIAITRTIEKQRPTILVFDSLSTLLIYLPTNSIIKFTQELTKKMKVNNIRAIFPIIRNKELIDNISMFVDTVVSRKFDGEDEVDPSESQNPEAKENER
ncbi:MAG: hypothetical protein KKD17_02745 [Nanoarchaeota archaeon]|nr:hypothetical protein [Nanoarchaeota archaeon]